MATSVHSPSRALLDRRRVVVAIAAALVVAAVAVGISAVTNSVALRLAGGVLVVLVPGLSLRRILRIAPRNRSEGLVVALGLGFVALIVGGLLVDLVANLTPAGWAGFVALLVGFALVSARHVVGASAPSDELARAFPHAGRPVDVGVPAGLGEERGAPRSSRRLAVVTAVVCVTAIGIAIAIAVQSAREQTGEPFTALAFESGGASLDDPLGDGVSVIVENRERVASTYELVVTGGERTLVAVDDLRLEPDERAVYPLPLDTSVRGTVIEAVLHRDGEPEPYRRITLTIP